MKMKFLVPSVLAVIVTVLMIGVASAQQAVDYDTDDDGLIEISYLEQLNAIRWDLDGDGHVDTPPSDEAYDSALPMSVEDAYEAAYPGTAEGMGCPDTCIGYELAADMDFQDSASYQSGVVSEEWTTGEGWQPISKTEDPTEVNEITKAQRFRAVLEGNRFTLSNLYIDRGIREQNTEADRVASSFVGLFAVADADIRSLTIAGATVKGNARVGSLVGINFGSVEAVWARRVRIESPDRGDNKSFGGVVGWNSGVVKDSTASGVIQIDGSSAGGLVGHNSGDIIGSHSAADVYPPDGAWNRVSQGGALVGSNSGEISLSWAVGEVTGNEAGGLVGGNNGRISQSYAESKVTGRIMAGGLVGFNSGEIIESWAKGEVLNEGRSDSRPHTGGLVGYNAGKIVASFAEASGVALAGPVGGLVGSNRDGGSIESSYAVGSVRGTSQFGQVGGLVGYNGRISYSRDDGTILESFSLAAVDEIEGRSQGGFVGVAEGTVIQGYWLREPPITIASISDGSTEGIDGLTSAQLQEPTGYTGIYTDWNENNKLYWDFGDETQYPALRIIGPDGKVPDQHGREVTVPSIPLPTSSEAVQASSSAGQSVNSTAASQPLLPTQVATTDTAKVDSTVPTPPSAASGDQALRVMPALQKTDSAGEVIASPVASPAVASDEPVPTRETSSGGCFSAGEQSLPTKVASALLMFLPVGIAGGAKIRSRRSKC